ncbi:siphovirus ReqiPepy6 Gp37-like family protein [Micromonospora krabiensis]|uniref:Virus ReqiPepy6 Gp37-like protein n=1 Tax=Micromonospora krabiensis TaxID=307121 RepID=A0A1C3N5R8_9ACTN|nr:siphovirus ReqiPepy6 Gp37-like family protein [Micromonospora krabiensis]SBV27932.1 virus ReqiPepy6 Gp37-like protein [Micromonospora krabiensis]
MDITHLTVEVRDKDLNRIGQIPLEDLTLTIEDQFRNVGSWTVSLPSESPLAAVLRQPGSGIIVTLENGDVLMSGPAIKPEDAATSTDPNGTLTVNGLTDDVLMADRLAFPNPANLDPANQPQTHDVRTGIAEDLMFAYVNANIGPAAPTSSDPNLGSRRDPRLQLGVNSHRGPVVTKRARFDVLGSLLRDLAVTADIGFKVLQVGKKLEFRTFGVTDRTKSIRLDIRNNMLAGHKVATAPPSITRAIVAGQDVERNEGATDEEWLTERQFVAVSSPESRAGEAAWGRRVEVFVDRRQQDGNDELIQAGQEALQAGGFAQVAVQVVPMEDFYSTFGVDWHLGDHITVVVQGVEMQAIITGYVLTYDSNGFRMGVTLGDPAAVDRSPAAKVQALDSRVSSLERSSVTPAAVTAASQKADDDIASLDGRLDALEYARAIPTPFPETERVQSYPKGASLMAVQDNLWSPATLGTVATFHHNEYRSFQLFNDINHRLWTRRYHDASGGWGSWDAIPVDEVVFAGPLSAGQWYRIASFPADASNAKASAEFVLSSDVAHSFIRLRASVAFNAPRATLSVEECSGFDTTPLFTLARIVGLNGQAGGHALEVFCTGMPAQGSVRMQVKHDDWKGANGAKFAQRWSNLQFLPVSATPGSPQTVLMQRGIWWTGDWTVPTLLNNWANLGSDYGTAAFRMRPGGVVELAGVVRLASGAIDTSGNTPSFLLPVGCRPAMRKIFPSLNGSNVAARVDVYPDGKVSVVVGTPGSETFDGITFLAEK